MGMSKRCRSPGAPEHEEGSSPDEEEHTFGQLDIRSFCSSTFGSVEASAMVRTTGKRKLFFSGDSEELSKAEPLLKLPGQVDIRSFLMPVSERLHNANEEAALAMGLSLGLESQEETEDERIVRERDHMEVEEAFQLIAPPPWHVVHAAAEEAAVSMGLSLGMSSEDFEEIVEAMTEEMMWTEAVQARDEARSQMDEDAAKAMGLSLTCAIDDSELELLEVPEIQDPEAQFQEAVAASICFKADEASARAMGLSLSLDGDAEEVSHLTKKARLEKFSAVPSPATPPKRSSAVEATPPRRSLAIDSSVLSPATEPKRRRITEDPEKDATVSGKKVADVKQSGGANIVEIMDQLWSQRCVPICD